ncbi:DNA -binding domain-containing protein [Magnetospira thiophila]
MDLFGAATVAADWDAGSWVRSRVRRRIQKAMHLRDGGYRSLLMGES